jgi:hypothetical protein
MIEKKLQIYLLKNKYLIKKYFSLKTLVDLSRSFQTSRIVYGACNFLDQEKTVEVVERLVIKYIKSVAGIKDNVSNDALRLALGIPKVEFQLYPRLMTVMVKYIQHFGELPDFYKELIGAYNDWVEAPTGNTDIAVIKKLSHAKSLRRAADNANIVVSHNYEMILKKHWYRYPDGRDGLVLRYMCRYGFIDGRLFENCLQCGEHGNNRTHATNSCTYSQDLKKVTVDKLSKLIKLEDKDDLEGTLLKIYFNPNPLWTHKLMNSLVIILKQFVASLYIDRLKATHKKPIKDQGSVSD